MRRWHVRVHYKTGIMSSGEHAFTVLADSEYEAEKKAKEEARSKYPRETVDKILEIHEMH
jgi:hypothetical protein